MVHEVVCGIPPRSYRLDFEVLSISSKPDLAPTDLILKCWSICSILELTFCFKPEPRSYGPPFLTPQNSRRMTRDGELRSSLRSRRTNEQMQMRTNEQMPMIANEQMQMRTNEPPTERRTNEPPAVPPTVPNAGNLLQQRQQDDTLVKTPN